MRYMNICRGPGTTTAAPSDRRDALHAAGLILAGDGRLAELFLRGVRALRGDSGLLAQRKLVSRGGLS